MNIDEILEDTADLAQEDIQTPIYRFDIDRLLEHTEGPFNGRKFAHQQLGTAFQ